MNQRDANRIACALSAAHGTALHAQTKATAWYACIEAVADAIVLCNDNIDRAAFLAACRATELPQQEDALAKADGAP